MQFVTIGSPNNRPDSLEFGCVPYAYEMAKYQLANDDWCEFLNAQGQEKSLRLKLYHKDMSTGVLGGINLVDGAFCVKSGWGRKPVVYINFTSVCRYCNWLTSGDTEIGSYDMSTPVPSRRQGAKYFIPNNDEWYKAAYWRSNRYVEYPTGNSLPRLDQANFERGDEFAVGAPYYFADVEEFGESATPDGVVQMGGNAWELLENVSQSAAGCLLCHYRGGSFGYTETGLSKTNCDSAPYNGRCYVFGVRIARMMDGWRFMRIPFKYMAMIGCKKAIRKCRRILHFR